MVDRTSSFFSRPDSQPAPARRSPQRVKGSLNLTSEDNNRLIGTGAVFASSLENANNVGVFQLSGRACLAQKLFGLQRKQPAVVRYLDHNRPFQFAVARLPRRAETAFSDDFHQVEPAKRGMDVGRFTNETEAVAT